jgi:hypothetical protein
MSNLSDQQSQAISTSPALMPEFGKVPHFGPAPLLEGENASAYNVLKEIGYKRLPMLEIISRDGGADILASVDKLVAMGYARA